MTTGRLSATMVVTDARLSSRRRATKRRNEAERAGSMAAGYSPPTLHNLFRAVVKIPIKTCYPPNNYCYYDDSIKKRLKSPICKDAYLQNAFAHVGLDVLGDVGGHRLLDVLEHGLPDPLARIPDLGQ